MKATIEIIAQQHAALVQVIQFLDSNGHSDGDRLLIEATNRVRLSVRNIDVACRLGLGHPIGPFQLMDATQLSLSLQVQEILSAAYGDRFKPRPIMKQMVGAGYNGKRSGRGWYKA